MKRLFLGIAFLALAPSFAKAESPWLGNVQIHETHRGESHTQPFSPQTSLQYNLADYTQFVITFEYYKQGVTDTSSPAWEKINAQVQLVKDSNGSIIKRDYAEVIGRAGNNAIYQIRLVKTNPDTVASLDPELQNRKTMNTHLNLIMDGKQALSVPIAYSYQP